MDTKKELLLDMLDDVIDNVRLSQANRKEKHDIIEMLKEIERFL